MRGNLRTAITRVLCVYSVLDTYMYMDECCASVLVLTSPLDGYTSVKRIGFYLQDHIFTLSPLHHLDQRSCNPIGKGIPTTPKPIG